MRIRVIRAMTHAHPEGGRSIIPRGMEGEVVRHPDHDSNLIIVRFAGCAFDDKGIPLGDQTSRVVPVSLMNVEHVPIGGAGGLGRRVESRRAGGRPRTPNKHIHSHGERTMSAQAQFRGGDLPPHGPLPAAKYLETTRDEGDAALRIFFAFNREACKRVGQEAFAAAALEKFKPVGSYLAWEDWEATGDKPAFDRAVWCALSWPYKASEHVDARHGIPAGLRCLQRFTRALGLAPDWGYLRISRVGASSIEANLALMTHEPSDPDLPVVHPSDVVRLHGSYFLFVGRQEGRDAALAGLLTDSILGDVLPILDGQDQAMSLLFLKFPERVGPLVGALRAVADQIEGDPSRVANPTDLPPERMLKPPAD